MKHLFHCHSIDIEIHPIIKKNVIYSPRDSKPAFEVKGSQCCLVINVVQNLVFCSANEINLCRFGMNWNEGKLINIFWVNYPFNAVAQGSIHSSCLKRLFFVLLYQNIVNFTSCLSMDFL